MIIAKTSLFPLFKVLVAGKPGDCEEGEAAEEDATGTQHPLSLFEVRGAYANGPHCLGEGTKPAE